MITVLGDGAWGTAIATVLAHNGHDVLIWCHNPEVAQSITTEHQNHRYLPKFELSDKITTTTELRHAESSQIVFVAIPIKFMRSVLVGCKPHVKPDQIWVSLSKGIENKTLLLPTQIIADVLGHDTHILAISGPSFAHDLAEQQPTGVNIAGNNNKHIQLVKKLLQNSYFQLEPSSDLLGIQLVGALKNVFALGIGLLAGAGYGANTHVLFMMRCMQEAQALLTILGYQESSLYDFAGIGDLVLTCFGSQSRNYQVGVRLGQGQQLQEVIDTTGFIPESINTLTSIKELSEQKTISLPLCLALYQLVFEENTIEKLLKTLCK